MNSRSSLNESNLVNLSGDLSALNQLDSKESLALSFPFDHIYACHSESSDRRQAHLDKEVDISSLSYDKGIVSTTNPTYEVSRLSERLSASENQNKKLKNLLVYHLDLIQQQNELMTKKDKLYTALKLENDTLKSKVNRMDRRITVGQRHTINPAPPVQDPTTNVTTTVKTEPSSSDTQIMFNSLTDFLMPDSRTNSYIFNNDIAKTKPYVPDSFELNRTSETDATSYLPGNIGGSSILDSSNLHCGNFGTMIENKRSYNKKEIKTEPRPEPLYTVTSNSGNTVIQKIQRSRRRTSGGIGSLSRLPKSPAVKTEPPENVNLFEDDKAFENNFSVNKKSKMINTYGKSKTATIPKKTPLFTGSLSDRLKLIDTTPTGEDPYQLGEADMREQSPIPKLMLQKTNHGRLKICSDLMGESTMPSRRIYDAPATETSTKMPNKIRLEKRYHLPNITGDYPYTVPQTTTHTSTHSSTQPSPLSSTHTTRQTSTRTATYTAPHKATYMTPHKTTYTDPHKVTFSSPHKTTYMATHKATYTTPHKATHTALNKALLKAPHKSQHVDTNMTTEIKKEPFGSLLSPPETPLLQETGLNLVKREPDLDWSIYSQTPHSLKTETSLCDFSYGENLHHLSSLPTLDVVEFRQLLEAEAAAAAGATSPLGNMNFSTIEKNENDQIKRRGVRTSSLIASGIMGEESYDNLRGMESKRGRKRALSTAGLIKNTKQNLPKLVGPRPKMVRGKGACRGKKSPLPGMMTRKPYHTLVGDPDLSWYLGLDPDVKMEDIDQSGDFQASSVEVPRWREKQFTSCYSLEGTEDLDNKVFEKRHQKLEAEERRQLRWHMRRIREQRHVERLRMRQRDPWYGGHSRYKPSVYTFWPQPQQDLRMIEITDTLPVMAFGENVPSLPRADFMLPWVRTSKALKRSKRSKTLL